MAKKHIDEATNQQLDYAVAVAQGWKFNGSEWSDNGETIIDFFEKYHPTTNQEQCGELIDEFFITCYAIVSIKKWECYTSKNIDSVRDKSRLVAACKAFLWSKYPDGMIPTEETKNE